MKKHKNISNLLKQRQDSAEQTRLLLHQALDRFEHDQLIHFPKGINLTLRNLALEAGVSKDTPLSKYRNDQEKAGDYRFPDIVNRFRIIKSRKKKKENSAEGTNSKIHELREIIEAKDENIRKLAISINRLDTENYNLKQYIKELEEQNINLRRDSLRVVNISNGI